MPGRLERFAPPGFVVLGLVMIFVGAFALSDAVAITFAVLGVALVCLGGLASRAEPGQPFEIGPQGLKLVLRDFQRAAEQAGRPEEAKALGEVVEAVDEDWFAAYLKQPRDPDPYVQASRLEAAWHAKRKGEEER
jgi:hypothetical protein